MRARVRIFVAAALVLSSGLALPAGAVEQRQAAPWSAHDTAGRPVQVPAADRPSLLLFLKPDQPQSREALEHVLAVLPKAGPVQTVVIFSGETAPLAASRLAGEKKWRGSIVVDSGYDLAGKSTVRVWPTTHIVPPSGNTLSHIAGMPKSYAYELEAYLLHATGKIDQQALDKRLAEYIIVRDSPQEVALRHTQVALQLLERGRVEQARAELTSALQKQPDNPALLLALASIQASTGEAAQALAVLAKLSENAAPAWQLDLVRGKAQLALGDLEAAAATLTAAAQLNPDPAENLYLLGIIHQRRGEPEKAAQSFRAAFEATPQGKKAAVK